MQYFTPHDSDVLILTPIAVEFEAIRALMVDVSFFIDSKFNKSYCRGRFTNGSRSVWICLRETGSGHLATAKSVQEGLQLFHPQLIVLFGTAGGLRKVKTGDIVVATSGCSYESGRVVDDGFYSNTQALPTSRRLVERARVLAKQPEYWKNTLATPIADQVKVYFQSIVSGDKVIASDVAPLRQLLRERFHDAIGLEMESYAFLDVAQSYPDTETLIVRGVSDLLGDKAAANRQGSKELAVANAAVFLHAFLLQDDVLITPPPYKASPVQRLALLGLTILLSICSFFWLKSDHISAFPIAAPFPADSVTGNSAPLDLTDNSSETEKTTVPPSTNLPATSKKVERSEATKPLDTGEKPPSIANEAQIPLTDEEIVVDSNNIVVSPPPSSSIPDKTDEDAAPEKTADLPTYLYKIYLEDQNGTPIRGATYLIDGRPVELAGRKIYLPSKEYHLEIQYRNYPPITTKIYVPSIDNGQTTQTMVLQ